MIRSYQADQGKIFINGHLMQKSKLLHRLFLGFASTTTIYWRCIQYPHEMVY